MEIPKYSNPSKDEASSFISQVKSRMHQLHELDKVDEIEAILDGLYRKQLTPEQATDQAFWIICLVDSRCD